jgi:predicted O-methyltransferase YrrM
MSPRSLLPEAIERYVLEHSPETPIQRRLREETSRLPEAGMQIGPDQAAFFALLVRAIGARRCLEIGTFTGYSALAVASALPPDGSLIACDVSEEWTRIARRYWAEAGVADRIELRIGPAADTLEDLLRRGAAGSIDFAFIDADKASTQRYYELCLRLARTGGLIAVDNVLWSGKVADPQIGDADTRVLREFNAKVRDDPRAEACLLTVGDGVMLIRRTAEPA